MSVKKESRDTALEEVKEHIREVTKDSAITWTYEEQDEASGRISIKVSDGEYDVFLEYSAGNSLLSYANFLLSSAEKARGDEKKGLKMTKALNAYYSLLGEKAEELHELYADNDEELDVNVLFYGLTGALSLLEEDSIQELEEQKKD